MKIQKIMILFLFLISIIISLNIASASSSTIYVNGSHGNDSWNGTSWSTAKLSIKNATGTVKTGGTIYIANGEYKGSKNTNIHINKSMSIIGQNKDKTIINGSNKSQIWILDGGNITIQNLSFIYGNSSNGGALNNKANLTISNCTLKANKAYNGGAIYNDINSSLKITQCNLEDNNAYNGGAIYNKAILDMHFNRLYKNNATNGKDIYNQNKSNVTLNWWGSNGSPLNKIYGNVTITPWLVLKTSIYPYNTTNSTITANLCYDSNGVYHNPSDNHIVDGIPVIFNTSLGTINSPVTIRDGVAKSNFISTVNGTANISTTLDDQTINKTSYITKGPVLVDINPVNNSIINNTTKIIKITFNTPIKPGTQYSSIGIKNNNGYFIPINKSINGNILTLTPNTSYNNSLYILYLPLNATMDLAGNMQNNSYTSKFIVNSTYSFYITGVDPQNNKTIYTTNKTVIITFSQNIKAGPDFSKIMIKNNGGGIVPIKATINGNKLIINRTFGAYGQYTYTVILPVKAVTNLAGNRLLCDLNEFKSNFMVLTPNINTRTYAILIGITYYKDYNYYPDLYYPSNDVMDMYNLCRDVWKIPNSNIFTLLYSKATKNNILTLLNNVLSIMTPKDKLVFYYAGHGGKSSADSTSTYNPLPDEADQKDEEIVPYDASRNDPKSTILDDELVHYLMPYPNVLCILDSCNSGGFLDDLIRVKANCTFLMAVNENESTLDDPQLLNGEFTYYLEKAFRSVNDTSIDLNNNGIVSAQEAFKYAQMMVLARTGSHSQIYSPRTVQFEIK